MAAGLALAASLVWGVGDFLGGVKSRVMSPLAVMAISQPFGLAALAVAVAVAGTAPPGPEVAWAALAAVLGTLGLAAFYRGMALGAISVVAPIGAVGTALPVVWGLVQGDRVSFLQELGFLAALGGSVMISVERGGARPRLAAGAGSGVLAMLGFGGYFIALHAASVHGWLWPAFVFRLTSVTLVWLLLLLMPGQRLTGSVRPHLRALVAIGAFDTAGTVFFAAASSSHGLLSVVSVLASLYPIVTVLLARYALGERIELSQNLGVATALVGVVLISAG